MKQQALQYKKHDRNYSSYRILGAYSIPLSAKKVNSLTANTVVKNHTKSLIKFSYQKHPKLH